MKLTFMTASALLLTATTASAQIAYDENEMFSPLQVSEIKAAFDERPFADREEANEAFDPVLVLQMKAAYDERPAPAPSLVEAGS